MNVETKVCDVTGVALYKCNCCGNFDAEGVTKEGECMVCFNINRGMI